MSLKRYGIEHVNANFMRSSDLVLLRCNKNKNQAPNAAKAGQLFRPGGAPKAICRLSLTDSQMIPFALALIRHIY
jgi:hypothetical protein